MFPAAAEVKRRRAATRAPSPPASVEPEAEPTPPQPRRRGVEALETLQRARRKADKDINVREQTRLRVKEEEERRRADEETLREELDGLDIEQMKNLAVIEEMEILPRGQRNGDNLRTPAEARAQAKSDRWDPAWNGRKNFKKFRRRGAEQGVASHKVIVQLEETPQTTSFSGAFFLEDEKSRRRSLQQRILDAEAAESDSESEQEAGFRGRSRTQSQRRTQEQRDVINVEDSGPDDEEVIEPRTQKSSGRTQRVVETQMSEAGAKKRAGGAVSQQPATKKGRFTRGDDDSDDEETGFRFKRRS